jgi:hypothetical protein
MSQCFNVIIIIFHGHIESRMFGTNVSERRFRDARFPTTSTIIQ